MENSLVSRWYTQEREMVISSNVLKIKNQKYSLEIIVCKNSTEYYIFIYVVKQNNISSIFW